MLGISRNASTEEIKAAYRQKAMLYHPDRNPGFVDDANERLKEINEAHEVLSDDAKRAAYDHSNNSHTKASEPHKSADNRADSSRTTGGIPRNGDDIEEEVSIHLWEAYEGTQRQIEVNGRQITVVIPRGADTGNRLKVSGKGRPGTNGGSAGDLYLRVHVFADLQFERRDDHLYVDVEIDKYTAMHGGQIDVLTMTGTVSLRIPPGTFTGRTLRLAGKGMPIRGSNVAFGDLMVKVTVPEIKLPYMKVYEWEALPKRENPAGYVYLVHDVELSGRYKIGRTNYPKRRFEQFRTATSVQTNVVHVLETEDATALERELHQRYAGNRKTGEWFNLSVAQVKEIINWDTEISTSSYYAASPYYSKRAANVDQYTPQKKLSNLHEAENWHSARAEKKKKLTWKTGCLYLFLFVFAGSLLSDLNNNSTSRRAYSTAGQRASVTRNAGTSANRAAVSTANRASATIYYVKTSDNFPANVRLCPRTTANCTVFGRLLPGEAVRQLERVAGEKIGGNENWIKFRHDGKIVYIHSSVLSSSRVSTPNYYVRTKNNASAAVRSCPRRTVDCTVVGGLLPGDAVHPQEAVTGESVNGNVIWFKFRHNGKIAYISSSLVTANP